MTLDMRVLSFKEQDLQESFIPQNIMA